MGNTDYSKITIIGVLALAVGGIFTLLNTISSNNIFSKLNPNQSYNILITLLVLGILILITIIILYERNKSSIQRKEKVRLKKSTVSKKETKDKKRYKPFILLTLILLAIFFVFKNTHTSNDYVLNEEFNNNKFPLAWREGNQEEASVEISNGLLNMHVIGKQEVSRRINLYSEFGFSLSQNDTFSICLRFKVENNNKEGCGLQWWGDSKNGNYYGFYLTPRNEFSIQIFRLGNPIENISTQPFSEIDKNFNVLKIQQIGFETVFFINNQKVATFNNLAPLGNEIGFGIAPLSKVEVDYIRVLKTLHH